MSAVPKFLPFADGLKFPIQVITEKLAFIGQSGGGKTYAAMKLAELMLEAGGQIVVIDIPGVWFGLASSATGKSGGHRIVIAGGIHGQIPINAHAGKTLANLVVDKGISIILDVSELEDADQIQFLNDFLRQLFERKKRLRTALHLFIDECQEVIPEQTTEKGLGKLRSIAVKLMKIGRNYGIGWSAITQEPQAVSKRALNQAGTVIIVRTVGSHERQAIANWARSQRAQKDDLKLLDILPELEKPQAFAWSPGWLRTAKIVDVLPKETFDSSKTPDVGETVQTVKIADINLPQLQKDIDALVKQAEASDPVRLQRRVAELEAEVKAKDAALKNGADKLTKATAATKPGKTKVTQEKVALAKDVKSLSAVALSVARGYDRFLEQMQLFRTDFAKHGPAFAAVGEKLLKSIGQIQPSLVVEKPASRVLIGSPSFASAPPPLKLAPAATGQWKAPPPKIEVRKLPAGEDVGEIGKGERVVLTAIAQHVEGVTKEQIGVLTAYKRSSRDTYLQKLKAAGLAVEQSGKVFATDDGRAILGESFEALPTGDALREYWLRKLPEGERRVLEAVLGSHPNAITKEQIDEMTGYKRSSRDTYLQKLGARKLVHSDRKHVQASQMLFG